MQDFLSRHMGLIIFPLVSLFLSLVLTWVCIRVLPKFGYIDKPGGRHIHARPVPRGGGIAVIIAFFAALFLFTFGDSAGNFELFIRLAIPAAILAALGMLDDRYELKSWLKLAVQLGVAFIIWYYGKQDFMIFGHLLPKYVSFLLSTIWVVGIINAFNLIDGVDGLASGLAIVSSCCLAIWFLLSGGHSAEAVCMLIMAAACLGFLRYNFHPAQIFLGDTGSTFLGLIFAVIGLSGVDRVVTFTSLVLPVLAVGVPLFDVCLAIWRRSTRKLLNPGADGIMEGDQDHLHHRLLRWTRKQTTTALVMYLLACVFSALALAFIFLRHRAPAVAYAILLVAVLIVVRRLAVVELFDSAQLIQRGFAKPRRSVLMMMVHPFVDFMIVAFSSLLCLFLLLGQWPTFPLALTMFVPVAITLCCSKVYRVYWLRAGLHNYWQLGMVVLMGSIFSITLTYFVYYQDFVQTTQVTLRGFFSAGLLFALCNVMLIELERFLLNYSENVLFRKLYLQYNSEEEVRRLLIYGGGLNCRLYISYLFSPGRIKFPEEVVGIIDDDNALLHLWVYGFKVIGNVHHLEKVHERTRFNKVVIATDTGIPENIALLTRFCRERNIEVVKFCIAESREADSFCPRHCKDEPAREAAEESEFLSEIEVSPAVVFAGAPTAEPLDGHGGERTAEANSTAHH